MRSLGAGAAERRSHLSELARLFLRLGTTAFGGPAAHIAMMEEEVVRRRGWLTREEFVDLLGATHLIPGPNSTEMAIHLGHRRAGWPGLVVAGVCFILPAALLVMAIAATYVRAGTLPEVQGILYGIKPVIVVVIVQALWTLGRTALKSPLLIAVAAAALGASLAGVHELFLLAASGLAVAVARGFFLRRRALPALIGLPMVPVMETATATTALGAWPLFLFFLKVGSVLFGSGYVLLAFLRADLVERFGWLTDAQLLDAIAVGQMTPGPVFTTATFVGFILGGPWMAVVATVGIFAPAFLFVALSGPIVPKLRRSPIAGALLDGINAGSLALMAAVTLALAPAALVDLPAVVIALVAAALVFWRRVHSAWLVLGGAVVGTALTALR